MISPSLATVLADGDFDLVVTSGQRLARHISEHQARDALAGEREAWLASDVLPWTAMLRRMFEVSALRSSLALPVDTHLLNSAQARAVWQQLVRQVLQENVDDMLGADALVEDVMQAFALMQRYQIDRSALAASAMDEDSQFLLVCIDRMMARLNERGWLLEEQLTALLSAHAAELSALLPERVLLAGFGQLTPDQLEMIDAFERTQFVHHEADQGVAIPHQTVACLSHQEEIIAAGQWARERLHETPEAQLAIVIPGLSGMADTASRWFSEGFVPGAQCNVDQTADAGFEVSFGQSLADYPAVSCALELLQAALRPQRFSALSRLLRHPVINPVDATSATRLELQLRELADRRWSLAAIRRRVPDDEDAPAWLAAISALHEQADQRHLPSEWAQRIDELLNDAGWLAGIDTDSEVFQLKNAFHASLNALASLDLVVGAVGLAAVVSALRERIRSTIYQPEGGDSNVLICGPLETLGLHFDAIWVAGLDSTRWPPAGRGASLLPRSLQREYALPDATPEQTRTFWQRQFTYLLAAAPSSIASYAQLDGDSELLPAPMIAHQPCETVSAGIGTVALAGQLQINREPERLMSFDVARRCHGGQATLRQMMADPFSASVQGRWGIGALRAPTIGVNAAQRGQIIHRALQFFYQRVSDSNSLLSLGEQAQQALVTDCVADAIRPMFVDADDVLSELLRLEEQRCRTLIHRFVMHERERPEFAIHGLEQKRELILAGLRISLRLDRVDRVAGGTLIIDYKTGANINAVTEKSVVDKHFQLLAYALTERDDLAGLALARIAHQGDPMLALVDADMAPLARHRQVKAINALQSRTGEWQLLANELAQQFIDGDIRLNPSLDRDDRKDTALLSRIAEEQRDVE